MGGRPWAHRRDVVRRVSPQRLFHEILRALLRVVVVHEALRDEETRD